MDSLFIRILRQWIPLAVGLAVISLTIYVAVQQNYRMSGYDPQIQMAEDMAQSLSTGSSQAPSGKIDIAKSLAPFTILYTKDGKVASTNAVLDGTTPTIPPGVLQFTNTGTENRLTWQPRGGVRIATIVVPYTSGYVLVGRNMREIEFREELEIRNIFVGLVFSGIATFLSVSFVQMFFVKKKR